MDEEAAWIRDRDARGWKLPPKAPWLLRLPVIRFIRAGWISYRAHRYAEACGSMGIGFGMPNQYDLWVIYAIGRGWC